MRDRFFNRREFCRKVTYLGGIFSLGLPKNILGKATDRGGAFESAVSKSRVVVAKRNSVRDSNKKIIGDETQKLVNTAIENMFQISPARDAWKKLFNAKDTVGIKINCLAGKGISTNTEVVDAIIEGLLSAGVPKNQIVVWDRLNDDLERAGFPIKTNRQDIRYFGNDYCGYDSELRMYGSIGSLVSRAVTTECTALINVPVLKDHGIVGVTLGLKNYFGAIHNPNKYHDNVGDPYVADVNMIPEIRNKTRLTICDGITAQYEGGPPHMPHWSWEYNGVLLATDMVALDTIGWSIIERKRSEKGKPSLKEAGREPTYIATAADSNHKLGTNDISQIELIET